MILLSMSFTMKHLIFLEIKKYAINEKPRLPVPMQKVLLVSDQ